METTRHSSIKSLTRSLVSLPVDFTDTSLFQMACVSLGCTHFACGLRDVVCLWSLSASTNILHLDCACSTWPVVSLGCTHFACGLKRCIFLWSLSTNTNILHLDCVCLWSYTACSLQDAFACPLTAVLHACLYLTY